MKYLESKDKRMGRPLKRGMRNKRLQDQIQQYPAGAFWIPFSRNASYSPFCFNVFFCLSSYLHNSFFVCFSIKLSRYSTGNICNISNIYILLNGCIGDFFRVGKIISSFIFFSRETNYIKKSSAPNFPWKNVFCTDNWKIIICWIFFY